jgi:hypothetical protein
MISILVPSCLSGLAVNTVPPATIRRPLYKSGEVFTAGNETSHPTLFLRSGGTTGIPAHPANQLLAARGVKALM